MEGAPLLVRMQSNYSTLDLPVNVTIRHSYYALGWVGFFLLGTLNNFSYVIILASAKSMSEEYGYSKLIGVVQWSLIAAGFVVKTINALYLEKYSHKLRVFVCGFLMCVGLLGLALAPRLPSNADSFWFSCFCVVISGAACSVGENVVLGYLKYFPPKLAGAWSSGTGMAGVAGSLLYLIMHRFFSNSTIYFILAPTLLVYIIGFLFTEYANLKNVDETSSDGSIKRKQKPELWICIKKVWYRGFLLFLVYYFEYVISVGLASAADTNKSKDFQDRTYEVLQVCYQSGVLISRSAVSLVRYFRLDIICFLQGLNFILWHFQVYYQFLYVWLQYLLMVFVGLLGGAMYISVVYGILDDENIALYQRELCMNIISIGNNLGITLSAFYEIIFFLFLFHKSSS